MNTQHRRADQEKPNIISEIIGEINSANKLSEVLTPDKFAPPEGWADKIASSFKSGNNSLKTSQLRKIFSEVKSICQRQKKGISKDKTELYLLYPKLAYAKGRNLMPKEFYDLLVSCIKKLQLNGDEKDFETFEEFMTAIVAYNKQYDK